MALSPTNTPPAPYVPSISSNDPVAKRVFPVDTLREMKEEKLLFNKVQYEPDNFFQFGAPGSGAPLRNPQNNEPIAKFGKINNNLWRRYADDKPDPETKKREMGKFIDMYAQKNSETGYYDPVTRSHIKPEGYWNDWFGKPGGGAPNIPWSMHKQNLNRMLEPTNKTLNWSKTLSSPDFKKADTPNSKCSCPTYDPYDPTCLKSSTFSKRFRSDHHTRYEIFPQ